MEDNKYYTPEIEEFHVGFEFEVKSIITQEWVPIKFNFNYLTLDEHGHRQEHVIGFWLKEGLVRVKYLDKEDIESLDWNYTGRGVDLWFNKEGIFYAVSGGHKFTEYKLQYGIHDNRLKIEAFFGGESEGVLFEGIIKNKSELERLMKQLGIYG